MGQVKDLESFLLGAQFGQKFNRHSLGTLENNFENNIERQNARNLISTTNTPGKEFRPPIIDLVPMNKLIKIEFWKIVRKVDAKKVLRQKSAL